MKIIFSTLSVAVFAGYWLITIFFNLPPNPIKIKFLEQEALFQSVFFQKWSFFAPPPKGNDRLYYFFKSKSDSSIKVFEVLRPITLSKQKAAPFNAMEEAEDYMISGSVSELTNFIYDYTQELKLEPTIKSDSSRVKKAIKHSWTIRETLPSIKTLSNYARLIASKNQIDAEKCEVKFLITNSPIPKFKDRNKPANRSKNQEQMLYETPYFSL